MNLIPKQGFWTEISVFRRWILSRLLLCSFHRRPNHKLWFLSCRHFVVNATFSTCLIVSSVSWLGIWVIFGKCMGSVPTQHNIKVGKERGVSYRKNEEISGWKAPKNTRKLNYYVLTITDDVVLSILILHYNMYYFAL